MRISATCGVAGLEGARCCKSQASDRGFAATGRKIGHPPDDWPGPRRHDVDVLHRACARQTGSVADVWPASAEERRWYNKQR